MPSESVVLNCAVQKPVIKPQISWINPQGRTFDKEKLQFNAGSKDNGEWTCVIKHNSEKKIPISVSVAGELFRVSVNNSLLISYICVFTLKIKVYFMAFRLLPSVTTSLYVQKFPPQGAFFHYPQQHGARDNPENQES